MAIVKVVTVTRGTTGKVSSHLLAFDPEGELLAIIEAHQLTARRTAAASVLAAKALGMGGARRLAIIGAGRQARAQLEAFADAMPIDRIAVWARRAAAAQLLADSCASISGRIRVAATPRDAAAGAEIISSATPSDTPILLGDWIAPGTHVDLVGGFRPAMREADDAVMARAMVVADTQAALSEAGDLVQPMANGTIKRERVLRLADLLKGAQPPCRGDLTVFKSVGHAAEDLVITELLLERLGLIEGSAASPAEAFSQ